MQYDLSSLSPEQRQLVERLLAQTRTAIHIDHGLQPANHEPLPLSYAQQRIWFLEQLHQGNPAYNIPIARRLVGRLDVDALERSINAIIERHAILRTRVIPNDGLPMQTIIPFVAQRLPLITPETSTEADRAVEVQRLMRVESMQPVDLVRGPLLRAMLIRLTDDEHLLLIVTHHFVADGWSVRVLLHELTTFYARYTGIPCPPLAPLSQQFTDYAQWQRHSSLHTEQLAYWKQQLAGELPILNLPTDYPRPTLQSTHGAHLAFELSADLIRALQTISRQSRATLFMTLATAFATLLHHYAQQDDIILATAVSNRNQPGTESLIGSFANTLLLRTDLSGNPSFLALLERMRNVALDAYAHQDLPFELLVEHLQPDRDMSRTPLFQVMFVLQNAPNPVVELSDLRMHHVDVPSPTARFDLEVILTDTDQGVRGRIEYNSDIFTQTTVARLVKHYTTLLHAITEDPSRTLAALPYMDMEEQHRLVVEWNSRPAIPQNDTPIHRFIEQQVAQTPQAIAVDDGVRRLSYDDLNRRANRLAVHLRGLGVQPNVPVGICLERSVDVVVGILAILKAGGAYVPLDPTYPHSRLAWMIADLQTPVILTQSAVSDRLPRTAAHIVLLDPGWEQDMPGDEANLEGGSQPDDLIYVIYTSGSTGNPKGTGIYQRGFSHLLHWFIGDFGIDEHDAVLLISALSFDLTQKNIFAPLMVGARLHLWAAEHYDPGAISHAIAEHEITLLNCTPSAFYPLVDEDLPDQQALLVSLRMVFLGGEPIALGRLARWASSAACNAEIVNTYGPTECTDICAFYRIPQALYTEHIPVPLGGPIPDVQLYVLGADRAPVPAGIPGELYIAGSGVGMGYLNAPALTAETFLPNWFIHETNQHPGARLYRSGDMVRWRTDGVLEFLGRIDQQVKIRGFRIETGEIETVLSNYPGVRDVAVVAQAPGDSQRLVAFIVPTAVHSMPDVNPSPIDEHWFTGLPRLSLPNGMVIAHQSSIQTNILYSEMFEARMYDRHGITMKDGDCIFDVGANIGMFSLFAHHHRRHTRIFAFEPGPETFTVLQANAQAYGMNVELFNCGLSSHAGEAVFTYYPHMSGMSSFFADTPIDRAAFTAMMVDQHKTSDGAHDTHLPEPELQRFAHELFDDSHQYTCQLRTISEIICEYQLEQIDLLKIDAEKSEASILAGISPEDWPKIKQLVLEVHSLALLKDVTDLLDREGYAVRVSESDSSHNDSSYQLFMIYARRVEADSEGLHLLEDETLSPASFSLDQLRQFARQHLPEYMVPSAFVLREALPTTPSGKIDRKRLSIDIVSDSPERTTTFIAPRTPIEEEIAQIWRQLLKVEQIGIHDNFFDLGGHSLLLAQVAARLRIAFHVEMPLRILFDAPTISDMTVAIAEQQIAEAGASGDFLSNLDHLSPEEIDRLLADE